MPIYDYACPTCEERFDELVSFEASAPPCPSCGGEESERLLSTFATSSKSNKSGGFTMPAGLQGGSCCGGSCGGH